jgi:NitT/TauT family transport system permease protein
MRRLVNLKPGTGGGFLLGVAPLVVLALVYIAMSAARHAENPRDRLLPTPAAMGEAIQRMAFTVDPQTGAVPLVEDTIASLIRIGAALGISTATTLILGLIIGLLPLMRGAMGPLVAGISVIPPIAVLPILFIVFGLGETAKIVLIIIGVTPVMVRDLSAFVAALPGEQMVKAQTLGASSWQLMLRVALPQAMPRLIELVRLSLCPAWVYLIAAEAIASDVGLGYRIFLVRRYLAMDVILPYVAWIALLAVIMDLALRRLSHTVYPWAYPKRGG